MPSDSSLAALITPQRPLTATVPFHSPETKAKGENPDDSQHIPSGTPNGVVGDTVNKTKSPGLVISENYTNPVIQPNPIRNRSLDDTVSELHGRKPAPDSESHDLSSYSTDGSVLSPSNTSHVQGSPVVSGATPDEVTGIMLLKPGYDTVPSMEELRHMARSQPAGELVVDDFTIQREGFGKVQFFGKTNVFGLNLDETVHIRRKEICVYPDEDLKPPQGEGLNKRARVTLTGTWPIDKSTREPIMDPERLQTMRYSEKVERSTLKMGATFIDYLPETGSWIFEVRHFSKYGLVDDDDSDDDSGDTVPKKIQNNQPQQQPRQQQAQQQPKQSTGQQVPLQKQPSHFTDNDTEMAEIPDDDSQRQPQQDANDSASVSSQSEVAIGLGGVNSRQVQVMKASFFGESVDENEKPQRVARLTPANAARHSMFGHRFSGNSLQSTSLDNSFMAGQGSHLLKQDRLLRPEFMKKQTSQDQSMSPMLAPYPQPIVLPTQRPPVLTSHSIPAARKVIWPVPWEKSLTKGKQKLLADAGLMMGRAFRVGWGPNWTLVHSGKEVSNVVKSNQNNRQMSLFGTGRQSLPRVRSTPYAVVIEKVSVSLDRIEDTQSHMLPSLEAVFAQSQRVIEDCDGVPYFSPSQGVSGLHTLSDALDKTYNKFSNTFSLRQADRTMKLAVALWGRLEGLDTDDDSFLDPDDSYERISGRRNAVSDWLAAAATEQIATDHPKTYLDQLFDLVAARQIPAACHLAQQHGDFQLAILLAQSSSTDHCRTLMLHQLAHYDVMKGSWFVDAKRLKIFVLLARGLTSSESLVWQGIQEHQSINACEGMDWKRCFALHLWYGCSATSSVKDALQQYSVAFKGRKDIEGYAAPPLPSHLEQNLCPVDQPGVLRQFLDGQDLRGHVRDTCYHLLKLYCKQDHRLERSLSPATYGFLPLDYFLSWILLQRLRSLEYNLMPGDRLSLTHTNFAAQLESVGLWHWAVFVLLHIEEAEARETAVRHMLARNCQLEPNEEEQKKEQFVSMNLLGSDEWLHEAKVML
jgi:nuclear pore complex protein Nup98-Nup96